MIPNPSRSAGTVVDKDSRTCWSNCETVTEQVNHILADTHTLHRASPSAPASKNILDEGLCRLLWEEWK